MIRLKAVMMLMAVMVLPNASAELHKIIFDSDFLMPPQDDGSALVLALNSPEEIEILGITIVAGNHSRETEVAHVLRMLEILGREDIPVYAGANMPLLHDKSDYAVKHWGRWWSDDPPQQPTSGFARKKQLEDISAMYFIVKTVMQNPGEITILAIGPLTNIAMAIRQEPEQVDRRYDLLFTLLSGVPWGRHLTSVWQPPLKTP